MSTPGRGPRSRPSWPRYTPQFIALRSGCAAFPKAEPPRPPRPQGPRPLCPKTAARPPRAWGFAAPGPGLRRALHPGRTPVPLRARGTGPTGPHGRRPHAEIIGEVARSRRPEVTFARCRSISSSVARPAATASGIRSATCWPRPVRARTRPGRSAAAMPDRRLPTAATRPAVVRRPSRAGPVPCRPQVPAPSGRGRSLSPASGTALRPTGVNLRLVPQTACSDGMIEACAVNPVGLVR